MRRLIAAVVAAGALACGLAACGGDDGGAANGSGDKGAVAMSFGGSTIALWNDEIELMRPMIQKAGYKFLVDDPQFKVQKQVQDWQSWIAQGEVKAIMGWPIQVDALVPEQKFDMTVREASGKVGGNGRQDRRTEIVRGGHSQRPRRSRAGFGDGREGLSDIVQDRRAVRIEQATGLGGYDTARGAHQQAGLQLILEAHHLLADHGFGDPEALGGAGKGAGVHDDDEIGEPVQIGSFHRL